MTSLYEELKKYSESGIYPCHMPGHKRKDFGYFPAGFSSVDFTEAEGLDDLHDPSGIILDAQKKAASVLGADETFFLINGSTAGILAAVSACTGKGGRIILVRNCHRSAYNAIYLRDLVPSYIWPETVEGLSIADAAGTDEVRAALDAAPDAQAVLIVSPTYEGRLADIAGIAEAVHERGIPLIVDEAHGAHLSFAEGSPFDAIRNGADIAIQSVHKTLPAPTQTSVLSVKGDLVDREKLRRFLSIYQSSSPSYPFMAMIDGCIGYMAENAGLVPSLCDNFEKLLNRLEVCDKLIFRPSVTELKEGRADYGKLLICSGSSGLNGVQIAGILRKKYGIETEMACPGFVLAMFTVCDDTDGFDRVAEAIIDLDGSLEAHGADTADEDLTNGYPKVSGIMNLSDAIDSEKEDIPLERSAGRICGSLISMYPPGTPILVPGEEISEDARDFILNCISEGLNIKGIGDGRISVVKNG
ncbi:MAG: aminotransferase class V-fold PLP-dependent enzyme [Lachnospiraceae bacterium]|nr:aminotransferase class V-fold PLP-dependent enzyme [Lachnospiraceae bacterium]